MKFASLEELLHENASRISGLTDFGDSAYRHGLRVLLDALDIDLQLSESARDYALGWILGLLIARLHTQKHWTEHPEVLAVPIQRPLVITGIPRTGTTALHKLLSVDSQFQTLEYWLAATPMIRPPREEWDLHPQYRARVAMIEAFYGETPELRQAHDMAAGDPEECGIVLMQSFVSGVWSLCSLPSYARWQRTQSARESYRRYADVLRLIGSAEPGRRWLLKDPFHLADIGTLLEVFPDACIIHTHRDPVRAIPSLCNLMHVTRRGLAGEPAQLGPRHCEYWRMALDRTQAACQRFPQQFFHVDQRRLLTEPLDTVRAIYDYFGLTLSPYVEHRMSGWIEGHRHSAHHEPQSAVDSWGVTSAQIGEIFADYRERHGFA
jgi:hypothetical protein